jgi:hypothetical protein
LICGSFKNVSCSVFKADKLQSTMIFKKFELSPVQNKLDNMIIKRRFITKVK